MEQSGQGPMQVVWLKRDLRLSDHEPMRQALAASPQAGPVLLLYIHEPEMIGRQDFSAQHGAFIQESLAELGREAANFGALLEQRVGEACEVLQALHAQRPISVLWSHQESGHKASFERDKRVAKWSSGHRIQWRELAQNGVLRGSALAREGFDFDRRLTEASGLELWRAGPHPGWLRGWELFSLGPIPPGRGGDKPRRLKGGRARAMKLMAAFCQQEKLIAYPSSMSSPIKAARGCSLLSAALSHGIVSDRELIQALNSEVLARLPRLDLHRRELLRKGALAYADRLRWRSSYLQCFESMIDSEDKPDVDPSRLGILGSDPLGDVPGHYEAWCAGATGVPMVDASMRMLAELGWINMRMRGMLASFAVGALGIGWREAGLHLAREFLDYEPGIHWSQMQIHSGVSRLSTPMAYSPVKQARDQDPDGAFIRRWVPELASVPLAMLAEPWKMDAAAQSQCRCVIGVDYPSPIVDMERAGKVSRQRLHEPRRRLALLHAGGPLPKEDGLGS